MSVTTNLIARIIFNLSIPTCLALLELNVIDNSTDAQLREAIIESFSELGYLRVVGNEIEYSFDDIADAEEDEHILKAIVGCDLLSGTKLHADAQEYLTEIFSTR
jgi:hypothetical protein